MAQGSGILLVMESVSVDAAGAAVATNRMSAFIRRLNGRAGGSAAGGARKIAAQGGPPSGGGTSFSGRGAPQQTQQSLLVPAAALGPLRPPGVPSPLFPKGALLLYEVRPGLNVTLTSHALASREQRACSVD